ncbi:class I SAM-dependent methyltransferase [Aquimarina sp. 2201CG14-23]|uniref:class I SAM-dependent methyltransferase n=1 Tax=Aquimarina mycalae TaxID=3040073 RepID=UPI002477D4E8|nr:class I SAM-dependent methyltransferase [Aquimarina sp. 2201CG14-23]MDH7444580.1 class I SAM-dependent methyltransferase [Aquimarina sp. 2201CG14-23]
MQIHETAFVVSTYRSHHEEVSKDIYAKLWNNPSTDNLIPEIIENISKHEAVLHSIRNRFFYEQMRSFFLANNGGTLINFGSGFSMYQFLLNENVRTIEIDKTDIVAYKKEKVDLWTNEGKLPKRDIQYVSIDFTAHSKEEIVSSLKPYIKQGPIFILLEGVLFFLDLDTTNTLFKVFKELQQTGDQVGSVSYLPDIENTEVYRRLLHYFDANNNTNDPFMHQTIPHNFYENINGYFLKKISDEFELSKIYAPNMDITDRKEILNENLYILQKE